MPSSALYPVSPGQKRIKSYCNIQLKRLYSHYPHGPFLSQKAYEQIHKKSAISEIDEKGVILKGERRVVPPAIFIRVTRIFDENNKKTPPLSPKVFIAHEELTGLSDRFGIPAGVLSDAFFMRNNNRAIGAEVSVKPSWLELLNPEWRKAFLKWRVGKGRMPDPSEFDWWIFLYKRITLPALRQMLTFRPGQKKNSKGRIVLSESGDLRYATFLYSKKRASKYLIGPDEIKWASRLNGDGETYDRFTFLALLGSKPTSIKYSFTKKAIKGNMISLGNIDGTTLVLRFASLALPVTEGNSFFIEVERYDSSLRFKCYKSSESKTLYAMGLIALNKGFPICQSVSMRSPAEA